MAAAAEAEAPRVMDDDPRPRYSGSRARDWTMIEFGKFVYLLTIDAKAIIYACLILRWVTKSDVL